MAFPTLTVNYYPEDSPGGAKWPIQVLPKPAATIESSTAGTINTPVSRTGKQRIFASVYATSNIWVTAGTTPADPSVSGSVRIPVPASSPIQIYLDPNDKLRWALA